MYGIQEEGFSRFFDFFFNRVRVVSARGNLGKEDGQTEHESKEKRKGGKDTV